MTRPAPTTLLLLGSNIEPERHLRAARARLAAERGIAIEACSAVYRTPAIGAPGSPDFRNQAAVISTALAPGALRVRLRAIEAALGRVRSDDPNAPRTIDIDIVARFDAGGTALPDPPADPELERRHHLALPAAELLPGARLRPGGPTLAEIARALGDPPAGFHRLGSESAEAPPR